MTSDLSLTAEHAKEPVMDRDPKIDPQVGDVLNKGGIRRRMTKRLGGEVKYTRIMPSGSVREGWCFITTWKAWAKDAVVEKAAE